MPTASLPAPTAAKSITQPRAALIEALDFLRLAQRDWRKPGAYAAVVAAWQFVQEALDALECDERHARAGMRP